MRSTAVVVFAAAVSSLRARTAALSSGMAEFTTATTGRAVGSALASWTWLPEVNSTMEEARRLLRERAAVDDPSSGVLAVGAAAQLAGRGTRGRAWLGAPGNVFLTVALPFSELKLRPRRLLPLRVGTLIAPQIASRLAAPHGRRVALKWPNDVLIGEDKVSGVLIEMDGDDLLVGIGVNLRYAPDVPTSGADRGRRATSMSAHGADASDGTAEALAHAIAHAIATWARGSDDAPERVVDDWSALASWDAQLQLRDEGTLVAPLSLESDGRLRVRRQDTGQEQLLVAEYLY